MMAKSPMRRERASKSIKTSLALNLWARNLKAEQKEMSKGTMTMLQDSLSAGKKQVRCWKGLFSFDPIVWFACASVDCNMFCLSVDFFLLRVYVLRALQLKYVRLLALHECPSGSN